MTATNPHTTTTLPIVRILNGVPKTTSQAIAEGAFVQHKNVLELVRTYQADLEEFGRVALQTRPFETAGGTQQAQIALLNERQATLLMTYMRNTAVVREFKKRLVKAFYELAKQRSETTFPANIHGRPTRVVLDELVAAVKTLQKPPVHERAFLPPPDAIPKNRTFHDDP